MFQVARLRRALRLVWQSGPGWTLAHLGLMAVQGALPLVSLYVLKLLVDAVAAAATAADRSGAAVQAAQLVGLLGAAALATALCRALAGFVNEAHAQVLTDRMHEILHEKSVNVDLAYYEDPRYYDVLHRAQREAPMRPAQIIRDLGAVGRSGIALVAVGGLLLSLHWIIAVVLLAATVPGVVVRIRHARLMYRRERDWTPVERQAWYLSSVLTGSGYAKEVRLFGLGPLFIRRFRDVRGQMRGERRMIARGLLIAELGAHAIATLAIFGTFAFMAHRAVQGALTVGDLVMFYQAFQVAQGLLGELLGGLAALHEHGLFLASVDEFLDLESRVVEPAAPVPVPRPIQQGIVLDHVTFRYAPASPPALDDVSLTIPRGAIVALVGENGSGKSTLVKLLCRLHDPDEGAIRLDGIDLRHFATAALRGEIGVLFQDFAHYYLTAGENIWLGRVDAPPSGDGIAAAAARSGADGVIAGLPRGYDTPLGRWFQNGEELSIGQWQKVALARTFFRDAQVVVLDEPSSALDPAAEHEVFARFRRLAEGRTTVLVSHRFSTVRMADCIYVLEHGRLVESGSHDELMRQQGRYARAYDLQARSYR